MTDTELESHECANGWTNADDARPCRICRPWHYACSACGMSVSACHSKADGKCCQSCPHTPPRPERKGRR